MTKITKVKINVNLIKLLIFAITTAKDDVMELSDRVSANKKVR